jgi:hypothetical protein
MTNNLVKAHRGAYDLIHRIDAHAVVTSNTAYYPALYPVTDLTFIDRVADKLDVFGLDFYYGASLTNLTALHQLVRGLPSRGHLLGLSDSCGRPRCLPSVRVLGSTCTPDLLLRRRLMASRASSSRRS